MVSQAGGTDLVNSLEIWAKATMDAKYSSVDNGSQSKIVEDLATPPPNVTTAIFALAFVVKAVYLCDLSGFVVSANESHTFWVSDFEGKEKEKSFNTIETTIDKVACVCMSSDFRKCKERKVRTHEEIICLWAEPSNPKKLHHVPELAVYVTAYLSIWEDAFNGCS